MTLDKSPVHLGVSLCQGPQSRTQVKVHFGNYQKVFDKNKTSEALFYQAYVRESCSKWSNQVRRYVGVSSLADSVS
jgi:hypothetical protein